MRACLFLLPAVAAGVIVAARPGVAAEGAVLECAAKDTLTAVELDPGDTLRFTLCNGQVRTLVLEVTAAAILERVTPGGIVYHFTCRVRIDGHAMTMERYACTQESFYEPYVVNGLRIWFDSVADTFQKIPIRYPRTGNLDAHPHKRARFCNCKQKGYAGFYRTNGGRAVEGEFARFTPDLQAGTYRVAFRGETPFPPDAEFNVRVRHRSGDQTVRVRPANSRLIGTFDFDEGTDGSVEIQAGNSKGLVVADAVEFRPAE